MRKFTILLTDDETLALNGLQDNVDWEALRVERLYKAQSKREATEILQSQKVDIVVTDIEMANGSGLELIAWIQENQPTVKTVIYTGHAEFSYARDALRLGAEDYLLKPIAYQDLEQILKTVENKITVSEKTVVLAEADEDGDQEDSEQIVEQVKKLIAENIVHGNLQRDELAGMVHVSAGYLGRIFKKETGMALTDYIIKKRIALAKQLLTKTSLSITDVSARVGISYSSYFTKLFKDHIGVSPQEYRQQHK